MHSLNITSVKKPVEYIVYDRFEAEAVGVKLESEGKLTIIQTGDNLGFAGGNNVGLRYIINKNDSDFIWLLNNDTVVEPESISLLLSKHKYYVDKNIKVGIIGAKIMNYYSPQIIQAIGGCYNPLIGTVTHIGSDEKDLGQFDNYVFPKEIDYPLGVSMFITIAFIQDIGLMCDKLFLYFEEIDWVMRGRIKGWQNGYCWQLKVYHKAGSSIGSSNDPYDKSDISDYYGIINRLVITNMHFRPYLPLVWLSLFLVFFRRLFRKQWRRSWSVLRIMFSGHII
jgi:GT2 family glycosyltransferase